MEFDPKKYSDNDLRSMNNSIVEELKRRRSNRIMAARIDNDFSVGTRVIFCDREKKNHVGTIRKMRANTALIETDKGWFWSVEYTLLKKADKSSEEVHSSIKPGGLTLIPGYSH